MRQQGTVISFEGTWGFIRPAANAQGKVFVHHSNIIEMQGYRELFAGDVVEYEVGQSNRGLHAMNVKVIQPAEAAA